jgi:hypothetical protein
VPGRASGRLSQRVPRRAPNQPELDALQERATLRTRVNKDGVTDWNAAARGWQAAAL